jgi:photosystem II stability/assembly factor-like uncharacterized protein
MSRAGWPLALAMVAAAARGDEPPRWQPQDSGTKSRLRGVCAVDDQVAWASGTSGTFARTTDGGRAWRPGQVPGADGLDFRDVEAFDARIAVLLASGPGDRSRIYRTADGGATWSLRFTNPDRDGFLDALTFRDADHGLALGDPVAGRFRVFLTDDGGATWHHIDPAGMPPALQGEGAFAASGTCLVALRGTGLAWFATGGATVARVFRTGNVGRTWTASQTPIPAGKPSVGIFSIAFRDADHGTAVGGDYQEPGRPGPFLSQTADGGGTWSSIPKGPSGYRSAVAYAPGSSPPALVAVGPTGSDLSLDQGATWTTLGAVGFNAISLTAGFTGWAVGDDGRVARLVRPQASK